MTSLFGHGIVGYTIYKVLDSKKLKWLLFFAILSTILPDADVLAFKINSTIIPVSRYQDLKEFYNQRVKKETEKVVLKKI
jgi:hypothetical protein